MKRLFMSYRWMKRNKVYVCERVSRNEDTQEAIDFIRKLRPGSVETEEQEEVIFEYEGMHKVLI